MPIPAALGQSNPSSVRQGQHGHATATATGTIHHGLALLCRCECPYGYVGPTCEEPLFPACRLAQNATDMHCGERMPRSCECFRQCRQFYCGGGKGACEMPRDPWYVRCFERKQQATQNGGSSQSSIFSDVPGEWEEKQGLVAWYRGIRTDMSRMALTRQQSIRVSCTTVV